MTMINIIIPVSIAHKSESQTICQETLDASETEKSFQKKFCSEYVNLPKLYQFDCLHSIGSNKFFQCISTGSISLATVEVR